MDKPLIATPHSLLPVQQLQLLLFCLFNSCDATIEKAGVCRMKAVNSVVVSHGCEGFAVMRRPPFFR